MVLEVISNLWSMRYSTLRNLDTDEIYFDLSNGHSPATIKCELPFLYVLMPLRVGA